MTDESESIGEKLEIALMTAEGLAATIGHSGSTLSPEQLGMLDELARLIREINEIHRKDRAS